MSEAGQRLHVVADSRRVVEDCVLDVGECLRGSVGTGSEVIGDLFDESLKRRGGTLGG